MKAMIKTTIVMLATLLIVGTIEGAEGEQEKKELKPVLVVMDLQNAWMPMMDEKDTGAAPGKINELIGLFRESDFPVVNVYHSDLKYGPEPGTEPFEFLEMIDVTAGDKEIVKHYPSAFTKTDLEQVLRDDGRNTVFLCGLSATGCALATYFGAMDRDFGVYMVEGTLLSPDASYTKMIESICYSMTIEEVKEVLNNPVQ